MIQFSVIVGNVRVILNVFYKINQFATYQLGLVKLVRTHKIALILLHSIEKKLVLIIDAIYVQEIVNFVIGIIFVFFVRMVSKILMVNVVKNVHLGMDYLILVFLPPPPLNVVKYVEMGKGERIFLFVMMEIQMIRMVVQVNVR